ncbi:MAG: type VI secretion system-associated FHA domain protein [Planctomycetota bacterium]
MPSFEVRVRRAGSPLELLRQAFELAPGQELTFGRAPDADVTIQDPDRKVSSRHGKIRCDAEGALVATDLGSLNGTFLEGTPVGQGAGTVVPFGSILRVSDYELEIVESAQAETMRTGGLALAARSLTNDLEEAYDLALDADCGQRATAMQTSVDYAIAALNRREGACLLENLLGEQAGFHSVTPMPSGVGPSGFGPGGVAAGGVAAGGVGQMPAPVVDRDAAAADSGADEAIRQLAAELVPSVELRTPECFATFCRLLSQVTKATLDWLAKSLQSRGVFAEEFGAEVTLVFQRSNNPLKSMSQDELRRFLLDWSESTDVETRNYYLEGVLKDLTEHQVGVIAGVKEAVAGVFARLAPERIEALSKDAAGWSKANKLWNAYQQLHQELSEEQSKLFQDLITPAIQKGYLHQHGDDA